ncbi:MAG: protein-disulfide reductase DsbD [Gallionella sp.]
MRFVALLLCVLLSVTAHADGFLDSLSSKPKATFLPPDQAFQLNINAVDARTLQANFSITPGYYLYRERISFKPADNTFAVSKVDLPQGETKQDKNFGTVQVFHQGFTAQLSIAAPAAQDSVTLIAEYQGCSEQGLCYPPIEQNLTVKLSELAAAPTPAASTESPANENSQIAQILRGGSFWLVVSFFFGAGLLLAFTPCIFPMIPILSGIIVGRGAQLTRLHAFILSAAYVLGMALTYAAAGVAAGLSGELLSNALQTPWVLGSFAAVFVVLALSMFGFYELQMPSALQSKLADTSNKLHGGHIGGVFLMGALSAIIMGPCVAAPLAGALLYISQTHDAVLGGIALFTLALGMGAPLLLIGSSAGFLLPKAGGWMEAVKKVFGVMLIGLAIWIIQPLVAVSVQMLLWGALFILSSAYLQVFTPLASYAHAWQKFRKGSGVLLLLLGVAYLMGALSGAKDILRPLEALGGTAQQASLQWTRIKDVAELDERISAAQGKLVVLDFYADWCTSCKEMERDTFSNPAVQAQLKNALLLQADVTTNSIADKALLKRYALFGPPATLFFAAQGLEVSDARVIGYQDDKKFLMTLQKVRTKL